MMNSLGNKLIITTFGESHGPAIGGVIDGFPSGFKIDFDLLVTEMEKRRPGGSKFVTQRKETDIPEFLSGISKDGITLGTPIGFIIRNQDNKSRDYDNLKDTFRPNHADFTYEAKYGIRDWRGGGRASARETANWVVAGALAQQWLSKQNVDIKTQLSAVGSVSFTNELVRNLAERPFSEESFDIPENIKESFFNEIENAKNNCDSVGGIVSCLITGVKPGIGSPVFNKLHSELAKAMMSINAAKGFEYGLGFSASSFFGSDTIDSFKTDPSGQIITETNFSGGIQGGISNGMPIFFNVAFKPTPTIFRELQTVNKNGESIKLQMKGRHDPCVAVRAVPVVKALAALVIADSLL